MHDLSQYDKYLEDNENGIGRHTKAGIPIEIYEEIRNIDKEYFKVMGIHLFREFYIKGDGDFILDTAHIEDETEES